MERKNIAFQYGIHRSPSAANEGELAECINLEVHNGELTPSVMPEIAFTLADGDKLLFVHKSGNYKNFIIQRGNSLCWFSDEDKEKVGVIGDITPTSIHSVGNTLVVLSEGQMEYILYKSGNYKRIGSKPPFCSISFGLRPEDNRYFRQYAELSREELSELYPSWVTKLDELETGESLTLDLEDIYVDTESTGSDNRQDAVNMVNKMTELYHSVINRAKEAAAKYGYFTDSFFVRYAYRMYDGSHYMHSAPCFFPICTDGYPSYAGINTSSNLENTTDFTKLLIGGEILRLRLDYRVVGFYNHGAHVDSSCISDWEDIIKGIDVFVTKGVQKITPDSHIYGFSTDGNTPNGILYCGIPRSGRLDTTPEGCYMNNAYITGQNWHLNVENIKDEDYTEAIKSSSTFYKISSFRDLTNWSDWDENKRELLYIKENTLTNLEQQEVLEDDYDSHDTIIPSFAHVYNGRLNISGIRTKIFSGYPMESMVPYTYNPDGGNSTWTIKTKMEVEGKNVEVVSKSNIELYENPAYLYYPSTKVEEFTSYRYDSQTDNSVEPPVIVIRQAISTFQPETHKLLNGSYYLSPSFGVNDEYIFGVDAIEPTPSGDPYIDYPNKIYTSEINNPFFFPLSGRNSIGTGTIIAITSNTKAISPGQFGQYPLIVFSTDGVWAMQTGEEGLYYSVHPISKDICTNPNVIQTDGPVLFVTENGLHSIVGETVENISRHMKGKPEIVDIPEVDDAFTSIANTAKDTGTFNLFIRDAKFAYDYANSRVLAYSEEKDFAYVLSTESGTISKLVLLNESSPVRMESAINAYPEVYMQSGSDIYTFVPDLDTTGSIMKGMLVTRTMAFSDPLAMKIINDVKLIYHRTDKCSRCRYAMFVSNDGLHWGQCNSLRSRSYKFFRFAVFTELADTDALQGMSVMLDYRRTNKLR